MKLYRRKSDLHLISAPVVESEGDDNAEAAPIWAVSYADLLMVLMSFFVIFYETKDTTEKGALYKIVLGLGAKGAQVMPGISGGDTAGVAAPGSATAAAESGNAGATAGKDVAQKGMEKLRKGRRLFDSLVSSGGSLKTEGEMIIITFGKNDFNRGSYKLEKRLKEQLLTISDTLGSSAKELEITIVGHADSVPLTPRNEFLRDNFDLSSIRALRAMKYLVRLGLPQSNLSIEGSSSNEIAARALTLRIRPKEKKQ